MIIQRLYKLLKSKSKNAIPLEDFTTEALAGMLVLNNDFQKLYLEFLELPEDQIFTIKTQLFYTESQLNCYIDLVLESAQTICFIENKVNSSEGWEQLNRYANVLVNNYQHKERHLIYCTKYADSKQLSNKDIKFRNKTWHQFGKKIKNATNSNIQDFYNFLKSHGMTNDYMITLDILQAARNLRDAEKVVLKYIQNVKNDFWPIMGHNFKEGYFITESNSKYKSDFEKHNRYANICYYVLGDRNYWSELIYGIDFERLEAFVGFCIDFEHPNYNEFKSEMNKLDYIVVRNYDKGAEFRFVSPLGHYLNSENAEVEIGEWFKRHFALIKKIVRSQTTKLVWNIKD